MRILGPVTEDEVVACFLRAELTSERYGQRLRTLLARDRMAIDVLARPDLGDPEANRYRRSLLDEHRAFERREGLFADFPEHVDWHRRTLEPTEVLEIRYITWDWWLRISGGTRSPVEAARRIRHGEVAHGCLVRVLTLRRRPPRRWALLASAHCGWNRYQPQKVVMAREARRTFCGS